MQTIDHIFIGTLPSIAEIHDELSRKTDIRCRQAYASHWSVLLSWAYFNTHHECNTCLSFLQHSRDGIQLLNKAALHRWFFENNYSHSFGRTDGLPESSEEPTEILVPKREIFRHYEGYNAVGICPALRVPYALFDNEAPKIIRYGYDNNINEAVNINSMRPYRDINPNGVDYKHCLHDMPEFFRYYDYIIDINTDINELQLTAGRKVDICTMLEYDLEKMKRENGFNKEISQNFIDSISHVSTE